MPIYQVIKTPSGRKFFFDILCDVQKQTREELLKSLSCHEIKIQIKIYFNAYCLLSHSHTLFRNSRKAA